MVFEDRPSARFTHLPVTSIFQLMSLLARRKNEIDFAKRPVFPFAKCPTKTLFLITAIAYLSSSCSGLNRVLSNSPFFGFYCHTSRIISYISYLFLSSLTQTKLVALLMNTFQKLKNCYFMISLKVKKNYMYVVRI